MTDDERKHCSEAYHLIRLECDRDRAYQVIGLTKSHQHADLVDAAEKLQGEALREEVKAWLVSTRMAS